MQYWKSILWLPVAIIVVVFAGGEAYFDPKMFFDMVDLLATIASILIGISIAIISTPSSPISIETGRGSGDEKPRIEKEVNSGNVTLFDGQMMLFLCYLSALGLALVFKWVSSSANVDFESTPIKALAFVAASISIFAFCGRFAYRFLQKRAAEPRRFFGCVNKCGVSPHQNRP